MQSIVKDFGQPYLGMDKGLLVTDYSLLITKKNNQTPQIFVAKKIF
jgi:hypothetical protein